MNKKQENDIRNISKFLRTVYAEDMPTCASILNAEANLLSNNDVSQSISRLYEALYVVQQECNSMIGSLKIIKNKWEENKL